MCYQNTPTTYHVRQLTIMAGTWSTPCPWPFAVHRARNPAVHMERAVACPENGPSAEAGALLARVVSRFF